MMKDKFTLRIFSVFLIVVSSLLIAARPLNHESMSAVTASKSELVRLTFENRSNHYASLRLEGSTFYYLRAYPGETRMYTPKRGVYDYTLYSCGVYVHGVLDLTKQYKFVVPLCGTRGGEGTTGPQTIDASDLIKLVYVTFTNEATTNLIAIFDGPGVFVFFIREGETRSYTIPKGDYTYTLYACGAIGDGYFYAAHGKSKDLTCPTP